MCPSFRLSYKIMTSAPSTTYYQPLDSDAPWAFSGEHTNLCCIGEYFSSNLVISPVSSCLSSCIHCTGPFQTFASEADTWALIRRCCCTITQLLWTKRYDIPAVSLLVFTFWWSGWVDLDVCQIHFDSSIYALIPSPRLNWRLPKITFLINRYVVTSLILCVLCNTASENMRITCSNNRLRSIRE
jgi:hypothetical protein